LGRRGINIWIKIGGADSGTILVAGRWHTWTDPTHTSPATLGEVQVVVDDVGEEAVDASPERADAVGVERVDVDEHAVGLESAAVDHRLGGQDLGVHGVQLFKTQGVEVAAAAGERLDLDQKSRASLDSTVPEVPLGPLHGRRIGVSLVA